MSGPPDEPLRLISRAVLDCTGAVHVDSSGVAAVVDADPDRLTYVHLVGADGSTHMFALPPAGLVCLAAQIQHALRYLPLPAAKIDRALRLAVEQLAADAERQAGVTGRSRSSEPGGEGDGSTGPVHG